MISLTCIFYPSMTEAGLLENKTLVLQNFKLYKLNGSSQIEHARNITSVDSEEENHLPETTTSNPRVVFSGTEVANESASKSEEILESAESSDVEDTYTGGKLDVFQFPLKKFTKYSHLKYGKVKIRPGDEEETNEGGEKKVETVKIVEEKVRINISIAEEGNSESNADVSPGINVTESTEPSVTSLENFTAETNNGTEVLNETGVSTSTEESVINEESAKAETPISVSTTTTTTSTFATSTDTFRANGSEWLNVTEDQKDIEAFKNDTLVIENKVEESVIHTTVEPFPLKNRLAAATSTQNFELGQSGMNAGSVTGIILGILVIFGLFGE